MLQCGQAQRYILSVVQNAEKRFYVQESPQEWSDQETLLLLEGMEMYGENWAEIAEHVGTRSQVQSTDLDAFSVMLGSCNV